MHIGILTSRGLNYHPNRRISEAADELGHKASLVDPRGCGPAIRQGRMSLMLPAGMDQPEVFLPRSGATIKDFTLTVVQHLERMGVPVINGYQSILLARNQFLSLQSLIADGLPVPDSYNIVDHESFQSAVAKLGGYPVVLKTTNSRQGLGVVLVDSSLTAEFLLNNLEHHGLGLVVQEYIEPRKRKDIRVFVLGDQIAAAMELTPGKGDFRTNIHLNSQAKAVDLNRELAQLAIRSAAVLGLEISGIDIIVDAGGEPKVIEVNYSPGFQGLEAATDIDIASAIVRYVTNRDGETYGNSVFDG
ncbi:RimK family alpha-L-glutamate ligase [Thermodesulfobacteriota bacterium]